MRKQLSTLTFCALTGLAYGQGQAVVQVLDPASVAGIYEHVHAASISTEPTSTWGVADLDQPNTFVIGTLVVARDGTAADTLGCEALTNAAEIEGNIAVIYRGTCNFSLKALNAQNAGATAVLIINNQPGLQPMGGGDHGSEVTIPVAQISQEGGATLREVLDTEPVTVLIGNNYGLFANNLSIGVLDVLVPSPAAVPSLVANASELSIPLGGYITNLGSDVASVARLRVVVSQDGSEVHNDVGEVLDLGPGEDVFVALPPLILENYDGYYTITYTAEMDNDDEVPSDNTYTLPFSATDLIAFTALDGTTGMPVSDEYVVPNTFGGSYTTCITFTSSHASEVAVTGLYFTGSTPLDRMAPADTALTDLEVTAFAMAWSDVMQGPLTAPQTLRELKETTYHYEEDLRGVPVFIPFDGAVILENDSMYLFCVQSTDPMVQHGWNTTVDYNTNRDDEAGLPNILMQNGTSWSLGFRDVNGSPSLAAKTVAASTVIGIAENGRVELTPFPNPTSGHLRIPMKGHNGGAVLRIFGIDGTLVSEQKVTVAANETMTVNLANMANGTYMFHVDFENGKRSDFRVVVAK